MSSRTFQPNDTYRTVFSLAATNGALTAADPLPVPAAPAPTTAGTGGTIAAGTYYFVVTYLSALGETTASAQGSVTTTGSTSTITVPAPASVSGASGWQCYGGTTSGSGWLLQGGGAQALGTNLTLTSVVTGTAAPPGSNTSQAVSGTIWHGTNPDATVAVALTSPVTGYYSATATIPNTYAVGDTIALAVTATIGGVVTGAILDQARLVKWASDGTGLTTEVGISPLQALAMILDILGGVRSGVPAAGSAGTIAIKDPTGQYSRGSLTVDSAGNITATAYTPPAGI